MGGFGWKPAPGKYVRSYPKNLLKKKKEFLQINKKKINTEH
jgi:hypothetical protein